jgi:hypothetical protein
MKKIILLILAGCLWVSPVFAWMPSPGGGSGSMTYPAAAGIVLYGGSNTWGSSIVSAGTCIAGFSGGTAGCYSLLSQDDSAAQFYNASAPTKYIKISPVNVTATKTATIAPTCTDNCTLTTASLSGNDTLVTAAATQTLTNKTIGNGTTTAQIHLPMTGATDATASGLMVGVTCGTTLAVGDAVYLASTGKVLLAKNDVAGKSAIGIMAESCVDTNTNKKMMTRGTIRQDTWNWATPGALVYISVTGTTGNTLTTTAPSDSNNIIQQVGIVIDADNIQWMPSLETMTVL